MNNEPQPCGCPPTGHVCRPSWVAPADWQWWHIEDSRTHTRASITSFSTRESALLQIQVWRERDAKGKRPDIHELVPWLVAVEGI